jgi:NADPH-dependent 7-cyano-7-deazaguanine reductase QueF-like protein
MITNAERSDLIHIMKMNRLSLIDADSAQLHFSGRVNDSDYDISVLVIEGLPSVAIKKDAVMLYSETVKSIDDLKILLEERLYTFLAV